MLLFDIGANRGDATLAGIKKGYTVVSIEAAPRVFKTLASNFIYSDNIKLLKLAVSDKSNEVVEFYEAYEDGLSTLNKDWLTSDTMPYNGKPYRTVQVATITVDDLVVLYGTPDLIKIDVEGAEWSVFRGMTQKYGTLTFEWTDVTIPEHVEQLKYLAELGYTDFSIQFIEHHLQEPEPDSWLPIDRCHLLKSQIEARAEDWVSNGWKSAGLRPTADVGMLWVR